MSLSLKIKLAQISSRLGDIDFNSNKIIEISHKAYQEKNDCLVFPELFLTGYPPEDLLLRQSFIQDIENATKKIITHCANIPIIFGSVLQENNTLFNVAILIQDKNIKIYKKQYLPNYGVFDEKRYFSSGNKPLIFELKNTKIGVVICEDIWHKQPIKQTSNEGAEIIISIHSSPFEIDKHKKRLNIIKQRALENKIPIIYLNNIGGQDELLFDGGSFMVNHFGKQTHQLTFHNEEIKTINTEVLTSINIPQNKELIYQSLVLATKDYIKNNNFKTALLGLSGGIDSALTLAIVNDAIGAENINTVMMHSPYTAKISLDAAKEQADIMQIKHQIIDIKPIMESFSDTLKPFFHSLKEDTTEENIQARIRGTLLMALSNKIGSIVITTGNKSEMAVGYSTLYGDMVGGFAPLKDVPKTLVYQLAKYRNTISKIIPEIVITRPPSAELKENQTDQDSLPEYEILDEILFLLIEKRKSSSQIIQYGFKEEDVNKITNLVKQNEYKRQQSTIGVKITSNSFGKERRYPITNSFKC